MTIFRLALLITAAAAAQACGNSATSMNVTAPAGARCQASVNNTSASFTATGGTGTVSVAVSRECAWTAVSQSPWVVIMSGQQGQGDGTVTFRVSENDVPQARQGALSVGDRQVGISQAAAPCHFDVWRPDESPVAPQGGELEVQVRTHEACSWTASAEAAWAQVSPGAGRGNAAVRVSVAPNSGAARTVAVRVANQQVTLTQAAVSAPTPPPTPPPSPNPPSPTPPPPAPSPTPPPPSPPPPPPSPPPPSPTPPPPVPPPPTPPPPAPPPAPPPQGPTPVAPAEIKGKPANVSGACPALTFTIKGQAVYTTAATKYDGGTCADIKGGQDLEIEGMLMSDGRIRADIVEIDD